jgi:hypothetical protein
MRTRSAARRAAGDRSADSSTTISDLPDALLVQILAGVPIWRRLGAAARVSASWAAAAAAATTRASFAAGDPAQPSWARWLRAHGTSLQQLHVHSSAGDALFAIDSVVLQCVPHLHTLQLEHCRVDLRPRRSSSRGSGRYHGAAAAAAGASGSPLLPSLRHLEAHHCTLAAGDLASLATPRLTYLSWSLCPQAPEAGSAAHRHALGASLAAALAQLPALATLRLHPASVGSAGCVHPAALQPLRDVQLKWHEDEDAAEQQQPAAAHAHERSLQRLRGATGLTCLLLEQYGHPLTAGPGACSPWQQLCAVSLFSVNVAPAVLAGRFGISQCSTLDARCS